MFVCCLFPLKITQNITIKTKPLPTKGSTPLSESCYTPCQLSICCVATIIIQNCLYSPGHGVYQSFTGSHDDVRWLADIWDFAHLHLPLEDPQRCSIGFKSGDILGQSITFTLSLFSKVVVVLEVCLGSLSCWNTALRPSFWRRGSCSAAVFHSTNWSSCFPPTPAALMQPQTMTFPSPCLTVGMTHLPLYPSPGRRHTCLEPSEPNKLIFISSDHRKWFQ